MRYQFRRFIDRFRPGDDVPVDEYDANQIKEMVANKTINPVYEPDAPVAPKKTRKASSK